MEHTVKFGLGFPAEVPLSIGQIVECARLAERKGFDAVWAAEGRGGEAFSVLTAIALQTDSIHLGAGIIPVFTRSPWVIAMGAAVVDELANQRFTLGLGVGHKLVVENRHGMKFERPLLRLRETLNIVRLALTGDVVDHDGQVFKIRQQQLSFKPQRSRVPIYVAATKPHMLQLAGQVGDGVFLIFPTPKAVEDSLARVKEGCRRGGRDLQDIEVLSYVFTCVSHDRRKAVEASRRLIAYYGRLPHYQEVFSREGFESEAKKLEGFWAKSDMENAMKTVNDDMVATFSASGTPDDVARKLNDLLDCGLQQLVLYPYAADGDTKRTFTEVINTVALLTQHNVQAMGAPKKTKMPSLVDWTT